MNEHEIPSDEPKFVRIMFPLNRDSDGYPPVDNETIWATACGRDSYRLDNIPFYAYGVSFSDVVAAVPAEEGPLRFREVIEPSFHSTIRVILAKDASDARSLAERMDELRHKLEEVGCGTEASHPGFFGVDIPPSVRLSSVREILSPGFESGLWDYEEATIWNSEH